MASARFIRRVRGLVPLVVGLQIVLIGVLVPEARATAPLCTVRNLSTTTVYTGSGSNLQTAINAANSSATLQIQGVCVGNFSISQSLALTGKRSAKYTTPRLDGNGLGTVLTVNSGSVSITNIKITNGSVTSSLAAGIQNAGNLTLAGHTVVSGNTSGPSGFGGIENSGTLTLNAGSSVKNNPGGGIGNLFGATLTMNGSSSVTGNAGVEGTYGAGIWNQGTVTLNGKASVVGNTANSVGFVAGGGVYNPGGHVTLNDATRIAGNTTTGNGGGVYLDFGGTLTMNDSSAITGNTAGSGGGVFIQSGSAPGAVAGVNVSGNTPDDIAP